MRAVLERFIVFEGLDGAGTTTQAELLGQALRAAGLSVWETAEPTDGSIGRLIRSVLHREQSLTPDTLAYLYAADRNEHLFAPQHGIRTRAANSWVICDRYLFSSLAYQSVDCDPRFVDVLNGSFPLPEWLFYIDVDPVTCAERRSARGPEELFDNIEFQRRVYDHYQEVLSRFASHGGMRILRIDGNRDARSIAGEVCSSLGFAPI